MPRATAIFYYRIPGNTICGQRPAGTSLSILSPQHHRWDSLGFPPEMLWEFVWRSLRYDEVI
jgi:hypothetical protein